MKWVLLFFIILLLIVLFPRAPVNGGASPAPTAQPTSVPTTWTATIGPPPTVDTTSPTIFYYLNMSIENMETSTKLSQLEHIKGASYQVTGVNFPQENGTLVFQVNSRCECAEDGPCCSPIRTFVVTIMAMEPNYIEIDRMVQSVGPVINIKVWCYDHANLTGVMSVPWADVVSFFRNELDGFRLWSKVTPVPVS